MTRRKRKLVAGVCIALVWSYFASYAWLHHRQRFDDARPDAAIYEFGALHWLTLDTSGVLQRAVTWRVQPFRVLLLLLICAFLGLLAWQVWRWIVRNSALQEHCDACGYNLAGLSPTDRCPECGELSSIKQQRLNITAQSWRRLLVALVLAAAGAAGMAIAVLVHAIHTVLVATNRSNPAWQLVERFILAGRWSLFFFIISIILFAIWLYLEPNKQRR